MPKPSTSSHYWRLPALALPLLILAACNGGGSADAALPPFTNACRLTTCQAAGTMASGADLLDSLTGSTWPLVGPDTSLCLPITGEIAVTTGFTVDASAIPTPATCSARQDCRKQTTFRILGATGVTCDVEDHSTELWGCSRITFAATKVRLRATVQDIHPSVLGRFTPIIDVLPSCSESCAATELACEINHTCWPTKAEQCQFCLGGSPQACGCWTGTAFAADGTACHYPTGGDTVMSGACHAGECLPPDAGP